MDATKHGANPDAPMRVQLVDVGPRDGLQNEETALSPQIRAELCDRLAAARVSRVEAASFVDPRRVPHMVGAEEIIAATDRRPTTSCDYGRSKPSPAE
jgi:(R)-citramalyl-CoA lyase